MALEPICSGLRKAEQPRGGTVTQDFGWEGEKKVISWMIVFLEVLDLPLRVLSAESHKGWQSHFRPLLHSKEKPHLVDATDDHKAGWLPSMDKITWLQKWSIINKYDHVCPASQSFMHGPRGQRNTPPGSSSNLGRMARYSPGLDWGSLSSVKPPLIQMS